MTRGSGRGGRRFESPAVRAAAAVLMMAWFAPVAGCEARVAASTADEFLAFDRDFADFESWTRFERDAALPSTHPDAYSLVYVNTLPPEGSAEFPQGTIIVRVTPVGSVETWVAHAMVKRGGDYNADVAPGWEFFDLHLVADGPAHVPHIAWRGAQTPSGDGYMGPDGGSALSCGHCHGLGGRSNDSVLGDELVLHAF